MSTNKVNPEKLIGGKIMDIHDPKKVKQLMDKLKNLYEQRTLLERGLQDIKNDILSCSTDLINIRETEKKYKQTGSLI